MVSMRLRYQDGKFVPLDPVPHLQDGDEIEVEWRESPSTEAVKAMLDQTRGLWADWEEIDALIDDSRQKWDMAWQDRLTSPTRRYTGNMNGERYLANTSPSIREVHDLDNEKPYCHIDEIIAAGHDKPYKTLKEAQEDGYDHCAYCIGSSTL